jgi:ribosomal protein S18 acetylase RimI-like enzyme
VSAREPAVTLRPGRAEDAADIAVIWQSGWRDGHLGLVPQQLVAVRTDESFRRRSSQRADEATVAVVGGEVAGFVLVVGDEVEQVYVASAHRGTGVAAVLLRSAEEQVAANGHREAWLAVVAGNRRARAFYERAGWRDEGLFEYQAAAEAGPIAVPCHRYTKRL